MGAQVRAALPGADAGGLQRIYAFLDHWGLINFEAGEAVPGSAGDGPPFELAPVGACTCGDPFELAPVGAYACGTPL